MRLTYRPLLGLLALLAPSAALAAPPAIDSGNTAWLLVSAALVMLMTPGLAFFYAGMVSRKNVVSTLLQNYVSLAIVGLLWVICGYSLVFAPGTSLIGGTKFLMLEGLIGEVYTPGNVPHLAYIAFQMMFAIICPALMTGSIAERVNFTAWMLLIGLWSLFVYIPVAHWVWGPGGWIAAMGGLDFAGGLVVHLTAGFGGMIAAFMYGKRLSHSHVTPPNNVPHVMLGAALLWFGWFGFNAGSAITAGALAAHAFILTFVGGAAAFLSWMVVDMIRTGKPTAVGAATGLVVGLVAITPAAGYVSIGSGIIMCLIAGAACNYFAHWIKKATHLDDALDVFACHGIGAVIGSVMTGVFATKAVNPDIANEGLLISGDTKLFFANLLATLAVAAFTVVMTYALVRIVAIFSTVRVPEDYEEKGLDAAIHGESVYWTGSQPNQAI